MAAHVTALNTKDWTHANFDGTNSLSTITAAYKAYIKNELIIETFNSMCVTLDGGASGSAVAISGYCADATTTADVPVRAAQAQLAADYAEDGTGTPADPSAKIYGAIA